MRNNIGLYRAKRKKTGEWIEGGISKYNKVYKEDKNEHIFIVETGKDNIGFITWMQEVDPETIGQYTGKKDKNKIEAYERDIVIGKFPYDSKCLIVWDEKRCGFYLKPIKGMVAYDKYYKLNSAKFEIIGNSIDNPELLKGDE